MKLTIHKFLLETDAKKAIELINTKENIGAKDNFTTTYTTYSWTLLNGFYIVADGITRKYLCKPVIEDVMIIGGL